MYSGRRHVVDAVLHAGGQCSAAAWHERRGGRSGGLRLAVRGVGKRWARTSERVPVGHARDQRNLLGVVFGEQGQGARIGDIDTGIDLTNGDIMPNVDVAGSCVFLYSDTPTAAV